MKARILSRADVLKVVDQLRGLGYEVVAPLAGRGRDSAFEIVTDANRDKVEVHVPNPYNPAKRYVFPQLERLLKIQKVDGDIHFEPTVEGPKRAIFGIRSCDLRGIYHLDRFFLGRDFTDCYVEKKRKNLFLVNVACTDATRDIGSQCFCMCTDSGPAARENFDLQIMDLGSEFMAVAGSPAGEALFSAPFYKKCSLGHVQKRAAVLEEARKQLKDATTWFSGAVRYVSSGRVAEKTWQDVGNRCVECGGCTFVCPACTCFTVTDREVAPGEIERMRVWDSCALSGFTRMAGGHNPRKAVHDRRNRRFFRKLHHYFVQRELSVACVGCGRCAEVCHGDVGMPSVVEMIRRAATESDKNESLTR
ncbi:MAG TPA: 4Fe-4S dicluster domain-containing protein [Anaeromyxobacteraceae bacterium]|nr:4Fe-4S dicluster domain-containing protein [Anaeromyxobacteraceae bacterium]